MHRAAGNIPGAIALKLDPQVLESLARKANTVAVISGTNGKTTTTNLVADCLATSGAPLHCNREGNNLQAGVVTALLVKPEVDSAWRALEERGVSPSSAAGFSAAAAVCGPLACFECDEMYTKYVLPRVRPRYFMLLNLFRDQLDRFGEMDHVQDTIAAALAQTPKTTFVYNGDDPLCAAIAARIPNESVAFGIEGSLGLSADRITDSRFCQQCGEALEYDYVHYSQLGAYHCPHCGWKRPELRFAARDVRMGENGFEFTIDGRTVQTHQTGIYMVYNILAAYAISELSGVVRPDAFQRCVRTYSPTNGRLQTFELGTRTVMTNLAKNPVGFNQNIRIVLQEGGTVLALFVNDDEADGQDISWFWDIDFERWAGIENLKAFVGGSRAADLRVRLKYAGISSEVVETAADVLAATSAEDGKVYVIANYTALPPLRRELEALERESRAAYEARVAEGAQQVSATGASAVTPSQDSAKEGE